MKSYIPDRGEVVWVDFNPQAGHEQAGHRPALVLSTSDFNRRMKLALVCPITSKVKGIPFEVPIPAGSEAIGVVLCQHVKTIDWRARNVAYFCRLPAEIVDEATGLVLSIADPNGVFSSEDSDGKS